MGIAMSTVRKIVFSKPFIICFGVVVFYTLAGFFLAPFLVRHYVPKIVEKRLQKKAVIADLGSLGSGRTKTTVWNETVRVKNSACFGA